MKSSYLLITALLLLPIQASAFYKCSDNQGGISYQKAPCSGASTQKKVHVYIPKKSGIENSSEFTEAKPAGSEQSTEQSKAIMLSKLSAAINSLAPIKASSAQYFHMNGHWPKKLSDIGVDKKSVKSSHINAVKLNKKGGIVAQLNSSYGENKKVLLQPKNILGGTNLEWTCYANFTKAAMFFNNHSICESRKIN